MASRKRLLKHALWTGMREGDLELPVNVFDADHDLVVTAPMPGVEAQDIDVRLSGKRLALRADLRGPGQERRNYVFHEWSYGRYARELDLPCAVDAEHANASFGNGVLTLTLPKVEAARPTQIEVQSITLQKTGTSEGHHRGHAGHRREG